MAKHPASLTLPDLISWMRQHAAGANLSADSRQIQRGDIFFAVPTAAGNGRAYIEAAIEAGAVAVVYQADPSQPEPVISVANVAVNNLQQQLGEIARLWYQDATAEWLNIAITGTNGKTSCSQWLARAISLLDKPTAVVGTLGSGVFQDGQLASMRETGFTTPDALQLHTSLAGLARQGARALAIEASSIGLEQGRLQGLHFDVAVFTNLTRDHLDYHGDMATYAAAKRALFAWPGLQLAVLNLDDETGLDWARQLQQTAGLQVLGYSLNAAATATGLPTLHASHIKTTYSGTSFHLDSPFGSAHVKTQLVGRFNVSNILAVMAVLLGRGYALSKVLHVIEKLQPVAGRMQLLGNPHSVMVVIDYAHTPDALEKTLQSLQEVARERHGKLWCVFGCGGDRDPGKRPQMGKIAEQADYALVTSDNPRSEEPSAIIQAILAGMSSQALVQEDRASAILYAIKHAAPEDVVLLAGKGHESYQEIKGKKWPFSDAEHAALALATVATSATLKRG